MKISLWTALQYAWGNRVSIASHAGYVDYTRRCAARPEAAALVEKTARSGAYPTGQDSGWRYHFTRLPMHDKLLERYKLSEIAEQGSTFARALRVIDWLAGQTCYNGMEIRACFLFQGKREVSERILRYSYDGGFKRAINCRHKAMVLSDCLMAVGIAALPLWLSNHPNCHYVVHAWLPEVSRWVMLDPSLNTYITDEAGRALSLIEIHEKHRAGEELSVAQYNFNGTQDCRETYLDNFIVGCLLEIKLCDGRTLNATELLAEQKYI